MRLTWVTKDAVHPMVRWRTQAERNFGASANASTTTYTRSDLCGAPATTIGFNDPGLIHTATMTNLPPATEIFYEYGDDSFGVANATFITPPPVSNSSTLQFYAFGDLGQAELDGTLEESEMLSSLGTTSLMSKMLESERVVVHIGDISYARGYVPQWDNFHHQITPLATRMPWMTCIGNHERDWPNTASIYNGTDSGGECGVAYERRFPMPRTREDAPWYSFESGPVHFTLMSTEHNFTQGSEQWDFLSTDLSGVDRARTPWVVVGGHRPMYIDSTNYDKPAGDQTVATALRQEVEPLLIKHKVDLALWGHHHSYQRTCPVASSNCVAPLPSGSNAAPVHMVIGMAGAGNSRNIAKVRPAVFEYVDDLRHGFVRGRADGATLSMEYISNDEAGEVVDKLVLTK